MTRKHVLIANLFLLAWSFLCLTGLYFDETYLVTQALKEDGPFFLIYLSAILLFTFKEKIGKYVLSTWLALWLFTQFISHEWYTIVGGGEGKIEYFKDAIKLIDMEGVYIPDLYHIILHILIILASYITLRYTSHSRKIAK